MSIISKVQPESLAEEINLEPGDAILSVNGQSFVDIIDLHMLLSDEYIELEVKKKSGEIWVLEVDKDYDEPLGVEWLTPTIDKLRTCHNQCVFCFVNQTPPNMRSSLQIRDDDYRLSFLHGNFVTLTNVKEDELSRIVQYHLSPINISVHTTNPDLRRNMLGNKRAGEIMNQIQYLTDHSITVHTQVVLCPSYNDQVELDRTIGDLRRLFPFVKTLSIVPVGLTDYRENLPNIAPISKELAELTIKQIENWQKKNIQDFGAAFVYAADEFYVIAGKEVPNSIMYDSFEQTENGIGLLRLFLDEFNYYMDKLPTYNNQPKRILLFTGNSSESMIRNISAILTNQLKDVEILYHVIPNRYFGQQVTVTGLVTGYDIIQEWETIKELDRYCNVDEIIIPDVMLKDDEDVFLDNLTICDVEETIRKPIGVVPTTPKGLLEQIYNCSFPDYKPSYFEEDYQMHLHRSQRYERV
ncbi:hypothetical protein BHU72_08070 [Desulfuribacillus stibiiarsenatis]|uniref:PDZ domain-containing protein n=1 Tax=Desulfuribacillus stibiiarsenatis TaxID=1390249 RepID=A0A1E5L3Q4_9FIRM|nr:DUF512 domain-containing protein [Desulfuribacillus stibiiarsenatis]OEH84780.1 hypothetical protein BHU72_08070 [Desulfuribacillus stibiiarsenatis]